MSPADSTGTRTTTWCKGRRASPNALDIIGWVTMENRSGKEFENAQVKLMAGDVNKVKPREPAMFASPCIVEGVIGGIPGGVPVVEKTFDEYHLYTLQRQVTTARKSTRIATTAGRRR